MTAALAPPLNTMKTQPLLIALLLGFQASFAGPVAAMPNVGRSITGTIQKVDAQAQETQMVRDDKGTLITFVWVRRTTFVANDRFTGAAILRKGARVEVRYRVPVFGKPFVTRVKLLPATSPTGKTRP